MNEVIVDVSGDGHPAAHEGGVEINSLGAHSHGGEPLVVAEVGGHGGLGDIKVEGVHGLGEVDRAETGRGGGRVGTQSAETAVGA